jgi:hypothetical protein
MQSIKQCTITGTHNKYQLKKRTRDYTINSVKTREKTIPWIDTHEYIFSHLFQKEVVQYIYNNNSNNNDNLPKVEFVEPSKLIVKELGAKLCGYKSQDDKKKRFNKIEFIQQSDIVQMLINQQHLCHYCNVPVLILYQTARNMSQWTVDRIDNSIGHNSGNCLIACLACNLQRGRKNKNKFEFTKQLVLVKNGGYINTP